MTVTFGKVNKSSKLILCLSDWQGKKTVTSNVSWWRNRLSFATWRYKLMQLLVGKMALYFKIINVYFQESFLNSTCKVVHYSVVWSTEKLEQSKYQRRLAKYMGILSEWNSTQPLKNEADLYQFLWRVLHDTLFEWKRIKQQEWDPLM